MILKFQQVQNVACALHFAAPETWQKTLTDKASARKVCVITDSEVYQYCLPILAEALPHLMTAAHFITIPSGEAHKHIGTCTLVWEQMAALHLNRNDLVIAFGGGVCCDLAGFCAASFKRGLEFVMIPTTLLSMVDSSIGGKVGVDLNNLKNLVGCFAIPTEVFIYPGFLNTLPKTEILSGMAEVLKHCAIGNRKMLSTINSTDVTNQNWTELIPKSMAVKAHVVQRDPKEHGLRKVLNFGHTFGHALEAYLLDQGHPIPHGWAVAIGMWFEMQNMVHKPKWATELGEILQIHYLPLMPADITVEALWPYMQHDKKKSGNALVYALPGKKLFTLAESIWDSPSQIRL